MYTRLSKRTTAGFAWLALVIALALVFLITLRCSLADWTRVSRNPTSNSLLPLELDTASSPKAVRTVHSVMYLEDATSRLTCRTYLHVITSPCIHTVYVPGDKKRENRRVTNGQMDVGICVQFHRSTMIEREQYFRSYDCSSSHCLFRYPSLARLPPFSYSRYASTSST
ncbi:hypothetical protein F4677DRAFT_395906 [Hypoxylon crocopeplum]|nr:hypothetical protein F4677DRAFT_395906 [Hypoxylon crocopeplum]